MDVRAIDTSSIAAKRVEFDKTRPVNQKSHSFMDERQAASQVDPDAEEQETDQQSEPDSEYDTAEAAHFDAEDSPSGPSPTVDYGEYHELDVRV
jgi:hypothetical protein